MSEVSCDGFFYFMGKDVHVHLIGWHRGDLQRCDF